MNLKSIILEDFILKSNPRFLNYSWTNITIGTIVKWNYCRMPASVLLLLLIQSNWCRRFTILLLKWSTERWLHFMNCSDWFDEMVDATGRPISWILLAPAVSPREPGLAEGSGPNNPSIRLVKFDTNSGQVTLDHFSWLIRRYFSTWVRNSVLNSPSEEWSL